MKKKEITLCDNHIDEYPTPLISTMAFAYCEKWCPYCGNAHGMFDGGTDVESTPELENRKAKYKERYSEYLHANGVTYASGTEWEGNIIHPRELPQQEKDRLELIRKNDWKEGIKIEEIMVS